MFSKKIYTLFIGKHFIDPGFVTLGNVPLFDGGDVLPYTSETLPAILGQVDGLSRGKKIRVVLGEELVYVTELQFPARTHITRELIRESAEASVPEDLRTTNWDYQTLRYARKDQKEGEISVQVAVIESSFSKVLRDALAANPLPIECVLPESYVLASLERSEGVSVIVERNRDTAVIVAAENGTVVATSIRMGDELLEELRAFMGYVADQKKKKVTRIIFSHFSAEALSQYAGLEEAGYEVTQKDYNPLIGIALQENVFGRDEDVLNIDVFPLAERSWWKLF